MNIKAAIINLRNTVIRKLQGLKRSRSKANREYLQAKGLDASSFKFRTATQVDIPKLAELHVKTWTETFLSGGPGIQIRTAQWEALFNQPVKDWFIILVEDPDGRLVGFAKAQAYKHSDIPAAQCELNKIFLLRDYQGLRLGYKLFYIVTEHLHKMGFQKMVLFSIPQNPSINFFEKMGGKRLCDAKGIFQGGYIFDLMDRSKFRAMKNFSDDAALGRQADFPGWTDTLTDD